MSATLEQRLAPALKAYAAALDEHGHAEGGCRCGYAGDRRSTGMHIAAAGKRADRAYDVAVDELLKARP